MISCHTLFDVHLLFAELDFKVVFALDFSKTVSEANLLKQFTFPKKFLIIGRSPQNVQQQL